MLLINRYLFSILLFFCLATVHAQQLDEEITPIETTTAPATNAVPTETAVPGEPAAEEPEKTPEQIRREQVSIFLSAADLLLEEEEYAEAERAYLRALEKDPENDNIRFRLSTLYVVTGYYAAAEQLLLVLVEKFPEHFIFQNNLAWVYATGDEVKDASKALHHAREALVLAPFVAKVWNTLAEAYYLTGDYEKALRASEHALTLLNDQGAAEEERQAFDSQCKKIERALEALKMLQGEDDF
jgi:tetratricopeptide (TPR) repeat protein